MAQIVRTDADLFSGVVALVIAFDLVQLVVDLVLDVLSGRGDALANVVRFFFCAMLEVGGFRTGFGSLVVMDRFGGVPGLAPGFFGCAFDLVAYACVGEFLVAGGFADFLFYFSCYLVEFSFNGLLVHGRELLRLWCV